MTEDKKPKKLDMKSIAEKVKKSFKGDEKAANMIGVGSSLKQLTDEDFIRMPAFWTESTHTLGIPYGKVTMLAGTPDSGKTSVSIQAMKAAQEQGAAVIYAETEGKTTEKDLIAWGVDPDQIMLVQARTAERVFTGVIRAWDAIKDASPTVNLFVVIDSLGNVVSERDSELDMMEGVQQIGGKGKLNRVGLNKLVAKMEQDNAAILLINYTYDNLGSPGKTNAGGQALNFFSSLTYQTARKSWLERTEKGKKVRYGAEVVFKLYKNHLNKEDPGDKEIVFRITSEGIEYVKAKNDEA
jgi:RecA/RadA recombinase